MTWPVFRLASSQRLKTKRPVVERVVTRGRHAFVSVAYLFIFLKMNTPIYQIDFSAVSAGKRVAATKRRIRW